MSYMVAEEELREANNRAKHFEELYNKAREKIRNMSPCDRCRFNPPSSCDGKPCCMCVAEKIFDEEEED